MKRIHLKDFAKVRGQPEAASLLGITQGALSKAIRIGRDVLVIEHADGTFTAVETRSFPSRIGLRVAPTLSQTIRLAKDPEETGDTSVHPSSSGLGGIR
ncbi:Cro/CI family transcriptional regulator [Pseudomonas sp. B21-053]|uniref:Cro/CI family transcriptional regulator n=1 Tax=Pseudomonas sp. B21-053 TaxID=2895493 RepID=UPI0029FEF8CC|nr:Cro/CI family transcriptional regulator [Pseudomonas sp. B21-053]